MGRLSQLDSCSLHLVGQRLDIDPPQAWGGRGGALLVDA